MSASEDYLDQLLNGMNGSGSDDFDTPEEPSGLPSDDDFLRGFPDDFGTANDDFLSDFEKALSDDDDDFEFPDEGGEDDDLFSFSNLDDLVNLSQAETDDSIDSMTPTSSRTTDENFNLGFDEPEEETQEKKQEEISAPESIPEDILNLLENVEEDTPEETAAGESEGESPEAAADDLDDLPIEAYEGKGDEEIAPDELDNPEHVKKHHDEDGAPDGEDEDEEAVDPAAVAAAAAAESGIVDEASLEAEGDGSEEDLLALLNGIDDGSDIGDLLNQDAAGVQELTPEEIENLQGEIRELTPEEEAEREEREKLEGKFHTKKKREKKKRRFGNKGGRGGDDEKKEKKPGLLARLLALFFTDVDELEEASKAAKTAADGADAEGEIEDENLKILQELDAAGEGDNGPAPAEDKKKKKKEKKEKPKKEKPKKEPKPKKEKKPKPKKEKKPKEKDTSPPLPKAPVIVIGVFAASVMIFILLFVKLFGQSGSVSDAQANYENGNYVAAFEELNGMPLSEEEQELFEKAKILGSIQKKYNDYVVFYDLGEYDMALDSLLRGLGRCYNYEEKADAYLITDAVVRLRDQCAAALQSSFGLSLEEAKEIYDQDRSDFSLRIHEVLKRLGLDAKDED